ncbi:unnamed protein product [Tilletia laevis]|uniref:RNB domain-containing protein n=3 Tax=Tilletia TaxID=13289 RepID=A0A8X7SZA4_9BASI|nr:hypothetical protein CF336_g1707 [Tilletia laevis]KAE8203431.1 hypothetical protein CF328_g1655 [Tilletia controversa]KAE8263587.1 hypothetical protein A4X03_0g1567 [Tilletia caries]KAE8207157.1 hypothetical protein CF335_g1342 [Tilletia laevis]KAE8253059.1 hypothetical protein A4X06_0g1729 [Tilletia controversa]
MPSSASLLPIGCRAASLSAAGVRTPARGLHTSVAATLDRRQQQQQHSSHSSNPSRRGTFAKKSPQHNRSRRDGDVGARGWVKARPVTLAFTKQQLEQIRERQDDLDLDAHARNRAVEAQYETSRPRHDTAKGTLSGSGSLTAPGAEQGNTSPLRPGDFAETRRSFHTDLICILPLPQRLDHDGRAWVCALTITGGVELYRETDIMFRIPEAVNTQLAEKAGPVEGELIWMAGPDSEPTPADQFELASIDRDVLEARSIMVAHLRTIKMARDDEIRRLLPAFQREFLVGDHKPKSASLPFDPKGKRVAMVDRPDTYSLTTWEAAERLHRQSPVPATSTEKQEPTSKDSPSTPKRGTSHANLAASSGPSAITLFATHSLLMAHPERYMADGQHHRSSQRFTRRASSEREAWLQIQQWLSAEQQSQMTRPKVPNTQLPARSASATSPSAGTVGPIEAFCRRARLVQEGRNQILAELQSRTPLVDGSPTALPIPRLPTDVPSASVRDSLEWTKDDQIILSFLKSALGSRRTIQTDLFLSIAITIVKRAGDVPRLPPFEYSNILHSTTATEQEIRQVQSKRSDAAARTAHVIGLHSPADLRPGPDLSSSLITRFLISIGVIPPWYNLQSNDVVLRGLMNTPIYPTADGSSTATSSSPQRYATLNADAEAVHPHDFGSLPVFIIDDAGAHELDDGISIEATSQPNDWWVHIHIADPTAILRPEDPLAMHAYRQHNTVYFPECTYPLLPDPALLDQVDMGSFRRRAASSDQSQRTLTFSAKINDQTGKVSEYKVAPSLVRNLKVCTYQQVQKMFDGSDDDAGLFSGDDRTNLKALRKISVTLGKRRMEDGYFTTSATRSEVKVSPLPLPKEAEDLTRPHVFAGFPQIDLHLNNPPVCLPGSTSETLISELMILAGRVMGAWAQEHGVAVPYRGQIFGDERAAAHSQELLQDILRRHRDPVTAMLDAGVVMKLNKLIPKTALSIRPLVHMSMAIRLRPPSSSDGDVLSNSGYVQCTSPLRRYGDLLVHWQVRAALAAMAKGKSPTANLPWQAEALQPEVDRLLQQGRWHRDLQRSAVMFWTCLHISRLLKLQAEGRHDEIREQDRKFLEPAPASVSFMHLRALSGMDGDTAVLAHGLGVQADCEWSPLEALPQLGQQITVKPIYVKFAGLRSRIVVRRV